jgi:predicted nucleic acid-binding protein
MPAAPRTIAVDTSVIVDLLGDDSRADAAESCLREALSLGPVVACEVVISEVVACLGHSSQLMDALEEIGLSYSALELRSAARAGEMQRRYNERLRGAGRRGTPGAMGMRTVPDFLIGAHALLQCQALITRDAGFFRDYFKGLKVIVPKGA